MEIKAETKYYRISITDPGLDVKRKISFPLHGTLKEKKKQVKNIQTRIAQWKLDAKMLDAKSLIYEAELNRRSAKNHDLHFAKSIAGVKATDYKNPLNKLFDRYKATSGYAKISVASQYQREKHFKKLVEFLKKKKIGDYEQVTQDDAVEFMLDLKCKSATYNKYLSNFNSMFKALKLQSPFRNISRKNAEEDAAVKKPFTDTEVETILSEFTGQWRDICMIAAYTGVRFIDAVHFNKSSIILDFNQQEHIFKIKPEKTQHTGRSLYLQIPEPLKFLLTKKTDDKGYFFSDKVKKYKAGTKDAGKSLNHVFKKKLKAIGIIDKSFHSFRHYFVDKMRRVGFNDEQIGSAVGHSNVKQTRDYGDYHKPVDLSKIV